MDDRHNLSDYYDGVLQAAALHLLAEYDAQEVEPHDVKEYMRSFRIRRDGQAIVLSIPYQFPDAFPTIHVPQPYFSRLYPIPHLDIHRVLCTFDPEESHPNSEDPIGVIEEVTNRAFSLIETGIRRENPGDYLDEFDSYWRQHASSKILSLIDISDSAKEIDLIAFRHPHWSERMLAVDSMVNGVIWLRQVGATDELHRRKALYLPLTAIGVPPLPSTNGELRKRLRSQSPEAIKPLIDFLDKQPRPTMVIFSMPSPNGHILGAWEHQKPEQIKSAAHKSKRKMQKAFDGFRRGLKNAQLELGHFQHVALTKHAIVRVDKGRLLRRGGDGTNISDVRIGIVGCGSIGSHIAGSLSDMGVNNLLLVDKDMLNFENVARHLCGAVDVGKQKVDAVSNHLASRLPHSQHTVYNGDVLTMLRNYDSLLNRCNFTVIAVGHLPTEFRLNELQRQGIIDKPLLYLWVEPYLAGAHAVFIDPAKEGCLRCLFDEKHAFRQDVLDNPGEYAIREAGCQSAYVPYSLLEVKRFIHDLIFFIEDIHAGHLTENILFTWLGNLSKQRENGRKVSSRWAVADDYTTRRIPLSNFSRCEGCASRDEI